MKEVYIQNENETAVNESNSETKILHIKQKGSYNELDIDKNELKKNYSCFNKLFIINTMLFMVFFVFCYYFILLILKGSTYNNNQRYLYYQKELNELNITELKTNQLISPKNIKVIKELNISVKIEHSKYVHLKISDINEKRWEVPQQILNPEYFNTLNNSDNSANFNIEVIRSNKEFSFYLYFETVKNDNITKNIFYSFDTSKNFLFSNNYINFESHLTGDDIFGFGERIHDFKLNEGVFTIWPVDRRNYYDDGKGGKNLYGHQPIGLHKTKYDNLWLGFVFLNSNAQDVQINKKDSETILSHKTIGGIIDYYIIVDNSPESVIKDIHYLIGIPILPPYWALGNQQCRWGYSKFEDFKNIYETYKKEEISIDTMWIDIDSMKKFQIFTLDEEKFKELPDYVENVIHKDHGTFVPIIDIGLSYNNADNLNEYIKIGNENRLFIQSGYTGDNLIAKVWPGKTIFPDFFNPDIDKLWDKGLQNYFSEIKYDGIWLDMNEISSLDKDGVCPGELLENTKQCNMIKEFKISYLPGFTDNLNTLTSGSINLNAKTYQDNLIYNNKPLISIYQTKQTYNFLKNNNNQRPFILTRSNSFGIGKYSFHWSGDNFSENEYIKHSISGIFNYNIFGIPLTGADICGFRKDANGELCARWYNIGAFYPFSRNHNSIAYIDQYPWSFGEKIERIIKRDIQYRYSLLRYFYSQLFLISLNEKGSFFKPVMFEFPNDMFSYQDIESKVMIGDSILICAFFDNDEKDKEFILPNSNFNLYPLGDHIINYSSNEKDIDQRRKTLSGKLEELHIFLIGGSIIPMQDTFDKFILNTYHLKNEKINLIINPDNEGFSKGVIFYDNGEIDSITNNNYIRLDLEFYNKILTIKKHIKDSYDYNGKDNILNRLEIWRVNELFKGDDIEGNYNLMIKLNNNEEQKLKGKLIKEKNKVLFNDINLSLFDLKEMAFIKFLHNN